jgi:hypothetical protein
VSIVSDESLYLAKGKEMYYDNFLKKITYTGFSALNNTWKTINGLAEITSLGEISAYLDKKLTNTSNDAVNDVVPVYLKTANLSASKKTVAENVGQGIIDFAD